MSSVEGSFPEFSWPTATHLYGAALGAVTTALAVFLASHGGAEGASIPLVLALAALAWLAERQSVQIGANTQMSVSVLPLLFAAVVCGPLPAMFVGACALLADFGAPYLRWIIWTSTRALAGGLAGLAATGFGEGAVVSLGALFAAVAAAALVEAVADVALNALTLAIRGTGSFLQTVRTMGRLLVGIVPLYIPVIALLAYSYQQISPWSVLLFFVPALAAQRLFVLYQEQRQLAEQLVSANRHLERANLSFAAALVTTLDARDRYTAGHSAAVAVYSRDVAARLGLSKDQQQLAHLAALVHDVGKIGLSPGLLEKTGSLTLAERRQMEAHAEIGERILKKVDDYSEVATIVRHHHERVDGQGYPDRLAGEEIPVISRIIAVADAYNAMTSDRPYRDAMPSRVARLRLAQAVESQFDTTVVAAFEAILAGASESYRSGQRADFRVEAADYERPAVSAVGYGG